MTSPPSETQRWGFSAIPNYTRSPFGSVVDGEGPMSTSGFYGLVPNNKQSYGYNISINKDPVDEFDYASLSFRPGGYAANPLAGMQFTDCTT